MVSEAKETPFAKELREETMKARGVESIGGGDLKTLFDMWTTECHKSARAKFNFSTMLVPSELTSLTVFEVFLTQIQVVAGYGRVSVHPHPYEGTLMILTSWCGVTRCLPKHELDDK